MKNTGRTSGRFSGHLRTHAARCAGVLAAFFALLSCGDDTTSPPPTPPPETPQPATVTVEPDSAVVVAGDTVRLTARVLDQRARVISGAPVTWTSGDPTVAAVDATGLVTGLKEGQANVTAASGPASASTPLTVRSQDREPLLELYDTTSGWDWTADDNWGTDAPLGDWYGVEANAEGRVVALLLSENGLRGELPESLGDLELLTELRVDGNALTGPLPISLAQLGIRELHYGGTMLCTLSDEGFREWLAAIPSREGEELACNEERADLAVLYEALGGPNWRNSTNWLTDAPLDTWWGIQLDDSGRVSGIHLYSNGLSGRIPSRIGRFPHLRVLRFDGNQVTGPIPPELGDLTELRRLELNANDLRGTIPPELGQLENLERLFLYENQLVGGLPPELGSLVELRLLWAWTTLLEGPIPTELGALTRLEWLDLSGNRLEGPLPPELGELTRLRYLDLNRNRLSGPLPPELGQLVRLEQLSLADNMLAGSLPPELGRIGRLDQLHLQNNSELSGSIPETFTALGLEEFLTGGTGLCAPDAPAFRTWLESILKRRVRRCGSAGAAAAYLTQAVQSRDFPVPLVAWERALLRVFITSEQQTTATIPPVRATFYLRGVERYVADIPAGASAIPTEVQEGELELSANAEIPGNVIRPGLEMVVEIDPHGTLDPGLGVARRIPETGRTALDVRAMPALELTFIPFVWTGDNDVAARALVAEIHPGHEILWQTNNLLPVGAFETTKHGPVTLDFNDAFAVLSQVSRIRTIEGGSGHWQGLMPDLEGAAGVAWIGRKTSVSELSESTIAHELGHNFNLRHADCGNAPGPDPTFPWPNAAIGAWGYDPREEGSLVPPHWADLMSYCPPEWISDYYFANSLRYRLADEGTPTRVPGAATRTLLISGFIAADGTPRLDPTFVIEAPPAVPTSSGPYELRGRRADGSDLFSLSFDVPEMADGDGSSGFVYALPVEEAWPAELASLSLTGPGGSVEMTEGSEPPLAILRDPETGEVRAVFRDLPAGPLAVSAAAERAPEPGLEVMISSGLPDMAAWRR